MVLKIAGANSRYFVSVTRVKNDEARLEESKLRI